MNQTNKQRKRVALHFLTFCSAYDCGMLHEYSLFVCLTALVHLITIYVCVCECAAESDSFNWVNNSLYMAIMPCSLVFFTFGSARLSRYCFLVFTGCFLLIPTATKRTEQNTKWEEKKRCKEHDAETHIPVFKFETKINTFKSIGFVCARVKSRFVESGMRKKVAGSLQLYNMDLWRSIWVGIGFTSQLDSCSFRMLNPCLLNHWWPRLSFSISMHFCILTSQQLTVKCL